MQTARVHRAVEGFLTKIDSKPRQVAAETAPQSAAIPATATPSPDPFRVNLPKAGAGARSGNPLRRK
jgi:hypothetical protein